VLNQLPDLAAIRSTRRADEHSAENDHLTSRKGCSLQQVYLTRLNKKQRLRLHRVLFEINLVYSLAGFHQQNLVEIVPVIGKIIVPPGIRGEWNGAEFQLLRVARLDEVLGYVPLRGQSRRDLRQVTQNGTSR
jgi:hypothetical protein